MKRMISATILIASLMIPALVIAQGVPYTTLPQGSGGSLYGQPSRQYVQPYRAAPRALPTLPTLGSPAPRTGGWDRLLKAQEHRMQQRQQRFDATMERLRRNARRHQPNPSDPYGVKPYTQGLGMPEWKQREIERSNREAERNRIMITGCHLYNKGCANELKSLGR